MLKTKIKEVTLKLLVAEFGNAHLALRMEDVHKIVRTPTLGAAANSPFHYWAQWENHALDILDLHEQLYGDRHPHGTSYTAILNPLTEQGHGIQLIKLPTILPIPQSSIKPIPTEEGDRQALSIASHFATIPQPTGPTTLFLMDTARLFQR